jgi:hypothetical protein
MHPIQIYCDVIYKEEAMEIAKFVLTAIGTFISVSVLSFAVFQYWAKRREEQDALFRKSVHEDMETERKISREEINDERMERKEAIERLSKKIASLERTITNKLQHRMGAIEEELRGIRGTLGKIESWFIMNTPSGGNGYWIISLCPAPDHPVAGTGTGDRPGTVQ